MVVADDEEHAAIGRGPRGVGVADRVDCLVEAGRLAVPEPEDAVVARAAEEAGLLAAPYRVGREGLVQPGPEVDVVLVEERLRAAELQVVARERENPR